MNARIWDGNLNVTYCSYKLVSIDDVVSKVSVQLFILPLHLFLLKVTSGRNQEAYKSGGAAIKSSGWYVFATQAADAGFQRDAMCLPTII